MRKYNVLDLFCGCGGLSKGFENAGFNIVLGIDNDSTALNTFEKNHRDSKIYKGDLSDPKIFNVINELLDDRKIDVIVGGPPCQGFSLTGPRNFEDNRNKLYLAMINAVKEFSPTAFVIENVPGMATLYKGAVKEEIIQRFTNMGYCMNHMIMCAADYGVPQMRKRLVFVGIKNLKFEFPKPTKNLETYITCEDALSDLPSLENSLGQETSEYTSPPVTEYQKLMRKDQKVLVNHVATNHTQLVKDVIAMVPEGGNHRNLPLGIGTSRKFNEAWTRYHSKKPSKTIDTGHRNHFHYKFNRVPTVRENARLQSFSDDFIFYGTKTQQNRQVGNAVPPLLGQAIAERILVYLNRSDSSI